MVGYIVYKATTDETVFIFLQAQGLEYKYYFDYSNKCCIFLTCHCILQAFSLEY